MTVPRSDSPLRIRAVADDSGGKTDAAIIARSKQEPSAFAELFDRHADCVHRFAARRLGAQLADDLLSETFSIASSTATATTSRAPTRGRGCWGS
jgi:hypothetical protein